jgi:phthalate 4,5-cis-dihydrodiol dehydrogenase
MPSHATSPELRLGIIGLGGGASQMIPAFDKHPQVRITAAADIDTAQRDAFRAAFDAATYCDVNAICQSDDIDAVYIATPNQFHAQHATIALQNRKHVLVEKPMTLTLAEADHIIAVAAANGVQLAVNVKHSFEPRIRRLRGLVVSGELGALRMLHYWYFNDWLYSPRTAEELNPELGGGVPWRQGPHQIDIIRTVAGGMVRSVRATTGVWDARRRVAGSYASFLEFENGVVATAVYSGHDHFNSKQLTYGVDAAAASLPPYAKARKALRQAGSVEAETRLKRARRFGGTDRMVSPPLPWILGGPLIVSFERGDIRLTPDGLMIYGDEAVQSLTSPSDTDGRDGVIDAFYHAVVRGTPPANDGRWGKATLEVLLALFESGKRRQDVILSHQTATRD